MSYLSAYPKPPYPKGNARLDHLPGDYGWPIVGHTLALVRDPYAATKRMYDRYGPVFRSSGYNQKAIIMVGPEPAREILQDPAGNLSARLGWHPAIGAMFEGGLLVRDFEDHQQHRKFLQFAFTSAALRRYFNALDAFIVCDIARSFPAEGERVMPVFPIIKRLALEAALLCLLDCDDETRLRQLQQAILDMTAATIALLKVDLPGSTFRRGLRGRVVTWKIISELMDEKSRGNDDDVLSELTRMADAEDNDLTRQDVLLHTTFMLMASHDTTASALTSMIYFLARHPAWQDRLREEMCGIEPEAFSYERLADLKVCDIVFKEAVRLHTPAPIAPRRTIRDCTIVGIDIPANTNVTFNAAFTHRMPEWWRNPDEFEPERYLEPRSEHKQHPMLWVPFGAGVHRCMGLHFALIEIKVFLFHFLRSFAFNLIPGQPYHFRMLPMPRPTEGLPLALRRLTRNGLSGPDSNAGGNRKRH